MTLLLPLTVPQSEVILNRIDAVVLEVDSRESVRANAIKIIKGTPATNPVKPTMISTNDRWQYPLAYIRVNSGVTSIRQADITNAVGTSECPFVTAPLEMMSIDALVVQWKDQWDAFYEKETSDMEATNAFWKDQWSKWFNAQTEEIQKSYLAWENNGTTGMLLKRQICRKQVLTGNSYGRPGLTSTRMTIHLKWLRERKRSGIV